jgi:hypothetical protein
MREFPGGVGNVGFDRFEHGGGEYRSRKPEARKEKPFDTNYANWHESKIGRDDSPRTSQNS